MSNSQSGQDLFVSYVLNGKMNGFFLEIGASDPIILSNTYLLETKYGWNGLMVEVDQSCKQRYDDLRKSKYVIIDATLVGYEQLFLEYKFPKQMDYLQIDLEVSNRSTLTTLEILEKTIFPNHIFSTVTFEHDIYTGDFYQTRTKSREIFERNGYIIVFKDVQNNECAYEDWYIHPTSADVNMNFINKIKRKESMDWSTVLEIIVSETCLCNQ